MRTGNKAEIEKALRSEQAKQSRLLERIYVAQENILLSKQRQEELRLALLTAPRAPKFFS